jgi:flavin-binding protein dodecin
VEKETKTGHSTKGFGDAAQNAIDQTSGRAVSFTVVEFSGSVSPNPGKISRFTATVEVTVDND